MNSDGSEAKFFGDFSSLYGLAWSPKGDEVWFTADPTTTTIARRLMSVSLSGKFRLLAAAPGDLTLHDVSPNGTAIITIDDRERKIFFTSLKGNEERELTWLDRAVLVALSADGKQVLFHEGGQRRRFVWNGFPAEDRWLCRRPPWRRLCPVPLTRSEVGARDCCQHATQVLANPNRRW